VVFHDPEDAAVARYKLSTYLHCLDTAIRASSSATGVCRDRRKSSKDAPSSPSPSPALLTKETKLAFCTAKK
jgi:hypothetical protein